MLPSKVTLCDANGNPLVIQAGASGLFIAQAGINPDGNRYASVAAAAAAAKASGPGTELLIIGDITAEATAIDITGIYRIRGIGALPPTLILPAGASLVNTYNETRISSVKISWRGTTACMAFTSVGAVYLEDFAEITTTTAATAGFIESQSGGDVGIFLGCRTKIQGSASHQVVKISGTGALEVFAGPACTIADNTITGGGAGAATIIDETAGLTAGGGAASISHSQTGLNTPTFVP